VIPRPLGYFGYKVAYIGLRVVSLLLRPRTRGVKCVLCAGDEILLVRHSYGPRHWDLPGGFVRRREAFEAAARRELAEELGAGADGSFTDLGELRRDFAGRHETLHGFRVDVGDRTAAIQGFELRELGWFRRDELPARRADVVDEVLALDGRFAGA
jgi:ADP-ribose pyrophosphatase YjhB (NUDIX family)